VLDGLVRLLEALVAQLETDSVVSLFWIGLGITSLGSALLSGGVRLVAATLAALERPSPRDLCVFLDRPLCSFLGDALEEDWGVRFGEDESFALGVLSLVSAAARARPIARVYFLASMLTFTALPLFTQLFKGLW